MPPFAYTIGLPWTPNMQNREIQIPVYEELVTYIQTEMPGVEVELSKEPVDVWKDVGLKRNRS